MAPTQVQNVAVSGNNTNTRSATLASTGAGRTIAVIAAANGTGTVVNSVGDNQGNTYVKRVEVHTNRSVEIWDCPNAAGGVTSVTVVWSAIVGPSAGGFIVIEIDGTPASSHTAGTSTGNGATGPNMSVASFTPSEDNCFILGGGLIGQNVTFTTPDGTFTLTAQGSRNGGLYKGQTTAAAVTCPLTGGASTTAWAMAAIAYKAAGGGGTDDLTADDITTGAPTLGTPALGQVHALTAATLSTGAPTLGTPAIAQVQALAATGITTGAPTLGAPTLAQTQALTAQTISTGAPTLGAPAIAQVHALAADSITTGAPSLGTPALTTAAETDNLTAEDITTGPPTLGAPALGQVHVLTPVAITTGAPTLGAPALNAPPEAPLADTGGDGARPRGPAELKALLGWQFIDDEELVAVLAAIES